eukprot:TRINITY_DN1168_c0_g1_i3.p1 TRINITY_DN1168_c0_g1~~TRINITY_DN1168_c0_g1_i3.p1  ORF type:complete len:163 (-),score=40.72 TRINITY_DN1168_c0_g1_i3:18-506(-)
MATDINRVSRESPGIRPRILCCIASPDVSAQYIAVMNCIFAAQKNGIPVDSCMIGKDSGFLQQASHLTGGIYLKPDIAGLLQYLQTTFLVDQHTRALMKLPLLSSVDYRASCFCHKKKIDSGFVCSVCLSIYCRFSPVCNTCGTKFPLPSAAKRPAVAISKS